eukprot:EG_transcript_64071
MECPGGGVSVIFYGDRVALRSNFLPPCLSLFQSRSAFCLAASRYRLRACRNMRKGYPGWRSCLASFRKVLAFLAAISFGSLSLPTFFSFVSETKADRERQSP